MRSIVFAALALCGVLVFSGQVGAEDTDAPNRDVKVYKVAKEKPETDLSALSTSARPKKVVIASNGSSFDLWTNGRMHLLYGNTYLWVLPFDYLGSFGEILVYKERTPHGWIWYFYPDGRIYFFTGSGGPYVFDTKAKFFKRTP